MIKSTAQLLAICGALSYAGSAAAEFVLQLPLGAKETYSQVETAMAPLVAVKPYSGAGLTTELAPDNIRRSVWSFGGEQTLAEVQKNILDQLGSSDYDILLFCQTEECGGFDFRFAIDVVAEPAMRVDLRDFRFISARQNVLAEPAFVTFLLSKSPTSVYVQMTEYAPANVTHFEIAKTGPFATLPLAGRDAGQSFVLEGLEFESGSAKLGSDPNGNIAKLAGFLAQDEALKVLLVGHSDMSGGLTVNITLSKKRAQTVLAILMEKFDIDKSRLSAHGVGFLSPRASNDTQEGQAKNRRVEAVFSR